MSNIGSCILVDYVTGNKIICESNSERISPSFLEVFILDLMRQGKYVKENMQEYLN